MVRSLILLWERDLKTQTQGEVNGGRFLSIRTKWIRSVGGYVRPRGVRVNERLKGWKCWQGVCRVLSLSLCLLLLLYICMCVVIACTWHLLAWCFTILNSMSEILQYENNLKTIWMTVLTVFIQAVSTWIDVIILLHCNMDFDNLFSFLHLFFSFLHEIIVRKRKKKRLSQQRR